MHVPNVFAERDDAAIAAFVAAHPLATLVAAEGGRPVVDHLPFVCDDRLAPGGTLVAHTALANDTWRLAERGAEAVAVFVGAAAYVSPSFYPSKRETHRVVPTWNYRAVHLRGVLSCTHEREAKRRIVERLTAFMEAAREEPWAITDAPAEYVDALLDGIVGLTLTIVDITAKTKASQNRILEDQRGTLEGLREEATTAEAAAIIARRLGS